MDLQSILLFIHILALVFWLGTDVGVFVLGKFAQNPSYQVGERLLLMKVGMILDMFPRVFMVVSIPTGYQMAVGLGHITPVENLTLGVWLFSAVWMAVVLTGLAKQGTPVGEKAKSVEKVLHYVLLATLGWASITSLTIGYPIAEAWLAWKLAMFALIVAFMLLLEAKFAPALEGFMQLANEGTSEALETKIRSSMDDTYNWVLAIYGAVFISALLGVWKFT